MTDELPIDGLSYMAPEQLTIAGVKKMLIEVKPILQKYNVLHIDLSSVSDIDTAGIQLLMELKKEALSSNKKVTLNNHSLAVLRIIDLYGLASFFSDTLRIPASEKPNLLFRYGMKKKSIKPDQDVARS